MRVVNQFREHEARECKPNVTIVKYHLRFSFSQHAESTTGNPSSEMHCLLYLIINNLITADVTVLSLIIFVANYRIIINLSAE